MVTGVMEHQEYACQPAGTLLRDNRDITRKNIYNSFILSSMTIKFCLDVFKDIEHMWFKGILQTELCIA
jgi:hypothetical protein